MKILKKIGFFKELAHGDPHGNSLLSSKKDENYEDFERMIEYLEQGVYLAISPKIIYDLFSKEKKIIGTLCIQTDGEWVWPSDLPYYIKNYKISVSKKFIDHIRLNKFKIQSVNINDIYFE